MTLLHLMVPLLHLMMPLLPLTMLHPLPMTVQALPLPMTVQVNLPTTASSLHLHSPRESYQHPHKYHMEGFKLFNLPQLNPVVIPMDLLQLLLKVLTALQLVVQLSPVVIPMDLQQLLLKVLTLSPPHLSSHPTQ